MTRWPRARRRNCWTAPTYPPAPRGRRPCAPTLGRPAGGAPLASTAGPAPGPTHPTQ
ncbi:type IV pili twitching motility protein PilT, partial [Burkholderia pseudomallei]